MDDAEVILTARALLDSKPEHPAVEIWEGKRLVARLVRNTTGETSQQDIAKFIRVVKQGRPLRLDESLTSRMSSMPWDLAEGELALIGSPR